MSKLKALKRNVGATALAIRFYFAYSLTLLILIGLTAHNAGAQTQAIASQVKTIPIVMLSDLHFDPFHDPAKVPRLVIAPIENWKEILDAPNSTEQSVDFAALQKTCKAKESADTSYALLKSGLLAAKAQAPAASFVTVGGDYLVHDLDCRYRATMGLQASKSDDQYASATFAEKTTIFVMKQVESTFSKIPVYLALGNNDSRCNHNRLDPHDEYLRVSASTVVDGLRGSNPSEKAAALDTYRSAGYYVVNLPAPMSRTRLLVVNDIYMMPKYATCEANENDHTAAQEQIVWLDKQLEDARKKGDHVWLLGHLPPAVNPDSSLSARDAFCTTGKVTRFQTTDDLADEMMRHADVVTLGIFGHTHMDELHLLRGKDSSVPIKVVGSVSPASGNLPSFTIGLVAPSSAKLMDYVVFEGSNSTGTGTTWAEEYAFDETYHEPGFTPEALADLIGRFRADTTATGKESQTYQVHFMKGSSGKKMSANWQGYVCSLDNATSKTFKACTCQGR